MENTIFSNFVIRKRAKSRKCRTNSCPGKTQYLANNSPLSKFRKVNRNTINSPNTSLFGRNSHSPSFPTRQILLPSRLPTFSFPTEITASAQDAEYETAEEFGSETPRDLSDLENEKLRNSPVIPNDLTPKASNQNIFNQDTWLADINSLGPSDTESSNAIDFPDEENEDDNAIIHPQWSENLGRESPVESEGSWLSGRMEIENAVRKSFHTTSTQRTPPIILESSPLPQVIAHSRLKIDTISAAVMNARTWSSASKPDYEGPGYESSGDESGMRRERVRHGSAARKVEVVDSPTVEGVVGRVSGEIVERDGEIILL